MTAKPLTKNPLLNNASQRIHAQGGRMTSQRQMILEALSCLNCHPTAEELLEVVQLRDPQINLSTVYRTLRWLEQEGLVSARRFSDDYRHDHFDPALPTQHHHFVCSNCKEVIEFDSPLIAEIIARLETQYGIAVQSASLNLNGLCQPCKLEASIAAKDAGGVQP
jgi:Fur family transcriptional regulator, ferric uptake regulator